MQKLKFPHGFLWGAATSAHQVEGNNTNSDWWHWERGKKRKDELESQGKKPQDYYSGVACDSYNRFDEDFTLAEHLSHNATRLGIEWARIEPQEGEYSETEFDHYEKVLQSAKAHGLTTFVTLHHFTSPQWFMDKGGFAYKENVNHFVKYAIEVARRLSEYVDFFITINEPEIYSTHGYLFGKYPPQQTNLFKTLRVLKNLIRAHNYASYEIKILSGKPVSMAFHLSDIQPASSLSEPLTFVAHYIANEYILRRTIDYCDFIGVNYYNHLHLGWFGRRKHSESQHDKNDLGWGIHPEGLERVLTNLKKYGKPVYITENGLADSKDRLREKFIKEHLYYVHKAYQKGVDVKGYLHWSLLDNFEWTEGFGPRFGLVEVDREDLLRRKVRHSAVTYAQICKTNTLEI